MKNMLHKHYKNTHAYQYQYTALMVRPISLDGIEYLSNIKNQPTLTFYLHLFLCIQKK
jgi:hypothetical protein